MKMFGWLNCQPWVAQYFEEIDGIKIAIENIDREEAQEKIRRAASRIISEFAFEIVEPLRGRYIACPRSPAPIPVAAVALAPGVRIYSPRMEPSAPGATPQSGCALYSGSICGINLMEHGLTVGHLFDKVGTECLCRHEDTSPAVGAVGMCVYKADVVDLVNSLRKTTADLALMKIGCSSHNIVVVDGRPYAIRLYRGTLDIRHVSDVAILSFDGQLRYGRVTSTLFTNGCVGLHNTMVIVDPTQATQTRVNDPGDSGALVISVPDPTQSEVVVYGMVIGYFESDDRSQSKTVATRLCDILEHIIHSDLDFAAPHMECSGGYDHNELSVVVASSTSHVESLHAGLESGYSTMMT